MLKDKSLTYVSLFSCAGVGCYGFKQEGYHCIATNELVQRRLNVQKFNSKCEYDSGYISGDITSIETKEKYTPKSINGKNLVTIEWMLWLQRRHAKEYQ